MQTFKLREMLRMPSQNPERTLDRALTTNSTSSNASRRLQRHHLEIAIICTSGIRLCCALASLGDSGSRWLAACLFTIHTLALTIESCSKQLGSPFHLRKCESHGLAEGILAVPSVLAALTYAAPHEGTWRAWLLGSCIAALSVLATISTQSHFALATKASKQTAGRQKSGAAHRTALHQHSPVECSHSLQNGMLAARQKQRPTSSRSNRSSSRHKQQLQHHCSNLQYAQTVITAAVCCSIAIGAGLFALGKSNHLATAMSWSQQRMSLETLTASAIWHSSVLRSAIAAAALAPALYCIIMHLLPGCFSIGEGALMAQGAAGLTAAAALAVPSAADFIPKAVCQMLPSAALPAAFGLCSSAAHSRALQLEALSSVILLILASTLLICLLLWALLALGFGFNGTISNYINKSIAFRTTAVNTAAQANSSTSSSTQRPGLAMGLLAAAVAAAVCVLLAWLGCAAVWTLTEFLPARPQRLWILLYWVGLLAATLPVLGLWANCSNVPQIIVRKVYHLLAGALFIPAFFSDLQLLCLSLAIAFAALVVLEVVRKLQLPVLGRAVQQFMQDFIDERDSGVIYVTHFTLLLGLAVPMWLCLGLPGVQHFDEHSIGDRSSSSYRSAAAATAAAGLSRNSCATVVAAAGSSEAGAGDVVSDAQQCTSSGHSLLVLAGLSGMVIIGVGDTAASMVGKLLGQVPIHAGSRKTVEGTVAGITSSIGAWCLLLWLGGVADGSCQWWLQMILATAGAGLMEAVTSQLDNVLLPLWYLPHLMLVRQ